MYHIFYNLPLFTRFLCLKKRVFKCFKWCIFAVSYRFSLPPFYCVLSNCFWCLTPIYIYSYLYYTKIHKYNALIISVLGGGKLVLKNIVKSWIFQKKCVHLQNGSVYINLAGFPFLCTSLFWRRNWVSSEAVF